jgi:threonine dehydratase
VGASDTPVTYADIAAAAERLAPVLVATPLLSAPTIDALCGARILVKAEMLQRTGSFKVRGAYNRLVQLNADERRRGVVAFSSGNHAQAVAWAARSLAVPAAIVMPKRAPAIKAERTRGYGAEVVLFEGDRVAMEAYARLLAAERQATLVPPFDDPRIIAGQGTLGIEIAAQARAAGATPDVVVVPCSGGGLVGGTAIALRRDLPSAQVYAVEPEGYDDLARSLAAGTRLANAPGAHSICDALLVPSPGELTFAINRRLLAGSLAVADRHAERAMAVLFNHLKIVAEPGGAIALGAVLGGAIDVRGKTVVVVASGGNVDAALFARILGDHSAA